MLILPVHNLKLVEFSKIFKDDIETNILNELDSCGLIKDDCINIKNKDVKRLFYHHIIHGLCEHVLSVKGEEKIVIVYSTKSTSTNQLHEYISESDLTNFLNPFTDKLTAMLPIKILREEYTVDAVEDIMDFSSGECYEIINRARSLAEDFDVSKFTFTKARYFAKRYGLEFLSNNYFQQILKKQLILM